ncbi:MAG: LCP family protein [Candidatus Ancillula sp.]|jgi:LCP family protein required for cell wall assembly|nr:LCP family protein [Candidatus Ancillula sp.]
MARKFDGTQSKGVVGGGIQPGAQSGTQTGPQNKTEKMQKIDAKTGELLFTKKGKPKYCWSTKKKLAVGIPTGIIALILVSIIGFLIMIQHSMSDTLGGNVLQAIFTPKQELLHDQNDRTNVLIFGTSEDEAGHGGAALADSILVLSANNKTGVANTISIPRDLWVKNTQDCGFGSEFKINSTYPCGVNSSSSDDDVQKEKDGARYFADVVGNILGLDIQYYAKMDWEGVVNVVDAVGGIDIHPYYSGNNGIYDKVTGLRVPALSDGETVHMDGQTALDLSRSRNSHGGYGLPRSNFDREINQQRILNAVREKAVSVGTLANPIKINNLFNALGDHMVSNIQYSELQSFADLASLMKSAVSLPLTGKDSQGNQVNYVTTGMTSGGASIVEPSAGMFDYSEIKEYIQKAVLSKTGDPALDEANAAKAAEDETASTDGSTDSTSSSSDE